VLNQHARPAKFEIQTNVWYKKIVFGYKINLKKRRKIMANEKASKFRFNNGFGDTKIIIGALIGLLFLGAGFGLGKASCHTAQVSKDDEANKALDEVIHVIEYKGGGKRY